MLSSSRGRSGPRARISFVGCGLLVASAAAAGCAKVERDWGRFDELAGNGGVRSEQGGTSSAAAGSSGTWGDAGRMAGGAGGSSHPEQGGVSPADGGSHAGGAAPHAGSTGEAGHRDVPEAAGAAGHANAGSGGRVPDGSAGASGSNAEPGGASSGGNAQPGGASSGGTAGAAGTSEGGHAGAAGASTGGRGDAGAGGTAVPECAIGRYGRTGTPLVPPVSTVDQGNDFSPSCGSGKSADIAVLWTAPASGWYAFDTAGSSFDTVLGIYEPSCDGAERACNNNVSDGPTSEVLYGFERGESALVVIDGQSGAQGKATLNVEPVTCPDQDLTGQPLPANLTTLGGTNTHTGACGGEGQLERMYRWTAPSGGLYRFSVTSDTFQPALYLERGPRCGGELLGCHAADSEVPASVTRWLPAGETVTVIVDSMSGSGPFSLNVESVEDVCSELPYTDDAEHVLDAATTNAMTSSCGPIEDSNPGFFWTRREHLYAFPSCCGAIEIMSNAPLTAYLLLGEHCDGPEVVCSTSTCAGADCTLSVPTDGRTYVLVVESNTEVPASYSVQARCVMCT
jgi:hypothetical protein